LGDVLAIRGKNLAGIAAAGQLALVNPPDFIGEPSNEVFFVRRSEAWWLRRGVCVQCYDGPSRTSRSWRVKV